MLKINYDAEAINLSSVAFLGACAELVCMLNTQGRGGKLLLAGKNLQTKSV